MSHHRLFIKQEQLIDTSLRLSKEKYRHLVKVLRLRKGETIECVTEDTVFTLTVKEFGDGVITVSTQSEERIQPPNTPQITLIQCLPKLDKFSDILRRSTELGVKNFVPCISERVDRKDQSKKIERWESVLESAAEQSHQVSIPQLIPITSLSDCHKLECVKDADLNLVCWEEEKSTSLKHCLASFSSNTPAPFITIFIGPEGGLTSVEIDILNSQGFKSCSIADSVLRVENAGFLVCSNILFYFK